VGHGARPGLLTPNDEWAAWLVRDRFGTSAEIEGSVRAALVQWRDGVLRRARIKPGDTVLDVGTGDGLVGLAALHLVGPRGHVVFSDVSPQLLDLCRRTVEEAGVEAAASYVLASAEALAEIPDTSVDVVTTRSVLMHIDDRAAAFRAFRRVLRPGGRLSCFESLAARAADTSLETYRGYDIRPIRALIDRLREHAAQPAPVATEAMLDVSDRHLSEAAEKAGFSRVRAELQVEYSRPSPMRNWEFFYRTPTHPGIPSLEELAAGALSSEEREALCAHLRPLVESGDGVRRQAICYLSAVT
jgi:arsenite methyltransferase